MKSGIVVLIVLVAIAMAKPIKKTSEATVEVDYDYNYDRDTHYNLDYDEYGLNDDVVVYNVEDFDAYELAPQYEIVRETDIEIDYTLEADRNRNSETTIRT
ncbi:uncharacterized protein LOC119083298 [Bradysia coprophila]|uniref:uncharacterized protein LOC119083298 n=1 Tax=Bradysia coprophila TaxID=38358 RepID=UPI00187D8E7B|nr:uncharacterized protein LOC119083298 [Bradysia coprophila]